MRQNKVRAMTSNNWTTEPNNELINVFRPAENETQISFQVISAFVNRKVKTFYQEVLKLF